MSDHDATPDPMDKAYVQAEAMLSDDAARAARRARVLAAVGQAAPEAAPSTPRRAWARGGWLVAASVAGVSVLLATQIRPPIMTEPPPAPTAPAAATAPITAEEIPAAPPAAKAPPQASPRPSRAPAAPPEAPAREAPASEPAAPPAPPPPPPPQQVARTRAEAPPPAAAAPSPAMDAGLSELVVTGSRIPPAERRISAPAASPASLATRLRAAAARGRTAEVAALLRRGVPVDAPDDDGETALMEAVRANHPDAAALLRRHGASLDLKSQAGQSARDMARTLGDPDLDRALDLDD